jgi:hypothetical protein
MRTLLARCLIPIMALFVESEIVRWGKVVEQAGLAGSE